MAVTHGLGGHTTLLQQGALDRWSVISERNCSQKNFLWMFLQPDVLMRAVLSPGFWVEECLL